MSNETIEEEQSLENQEDLGNIDEIEALPAVTKFQAQEDVSCIQANHPEANIVINNSDSPIEVFIKDSATGKKTILAPAEGQTPTNIMRETDFDVKAVPLKHPSGKYGVHHRRLIKLSYKKYFKARLFHTFTIMSVF